MISHCFINHLTHVGELFDVIVVQDATFFAVQLYYLLTNFFLYVLIVYQNVSNKTKCCADDNNIKIKINIYFLLEKILPS